MTALDILQERGLSAIEFVESPSSGNVTMKLVETKGSGIRAFTDGEIRNAALLLLIQTVERLQTEIAELRGTGKRQKAGVR